MALSISLLALVAGKFRLLLRFQTLVAFLIVLAVWRLFIAGDAAWPTVEVPVKNSRAAKSLTAVVILLAAFFPTPGQFMHQYPYVRAFKLPSDSMCPTFCLGERLTADMNAFKEKVPTRGDIIIFEYKSRQQFVKRVIGIGGDSVASGPGGTVMVNGNKISAPPTCGEPILQKDEQKESPEFGAVTVPEDSLFVVGDNLANSYDSRIPGFGFVTLDQVRGRPLFLYWSPDRSRIGCLVR